MKKVLLVLILLLSLVSCGGSKGGSSSSEVFNNNTSKVDYDLTKMSSTMVYSQVANMLEKPGDYYNKTFRINGSYAKSFYEPTSKYYHYIVIQDALACCNQGLEFVWKGDHSLDDYPSSGDNIVISGKFSYYYELGVKYDCIFIE